MRAFCIQPKPQVRLEQKWYRWKGNRKWGIRLLTQNFMGTRMRTHGRLEGVRIRTCEQVYRLNHWSDLDKCGIVGNVVWVACYCVHARARVHKYYSSCKCTEKRHEDYTNIDHRSIV